MTDLAGRLARIAELHASGAHRMMGTDGWCVECQHRWPCDTYRAAAGEGDVPGLTVGRPRAGWWARARRAWVGAPLPGQLVVLDTAAARVMEAAAVAELQAGLDLDEEARVEAGDTARRAVRAAVAGLLFGGGR